MGSNPVWRIDLRKAVTQTVTKPGAATAAADICESTARSVSATVSPLHYRYLSCHTDSSINEGHEAAVLGSGSIPIATPSRIPARF